jgi:hypothetical protein
VHVAERRRVGRDGELVPVERGCVRLLRQLVLEHVERERVLEEEGVPADAGKRRGQRDRRPGPRLLARRRHLGQTLDGKAEPLAEVEAVLGEQIQVRVTRLANDASGRRRLRAAARARRSVGRGHAQDDAGEEHERSDRGHARGA